MYLVVYLPSCQRNNPRTQLSDIYPYDIPSNLLFEKYNTPVANIPGLRRPRVQWPVWWLHGLPHTVNRPCGAVVTWCFMHGPPLRFYQSNALVKQACRPQNMFCRSVPCTRKQGHSTGPKEPHLQKSSVGLKRTWCRQPDSSTPSRWTSRSNPGMLKKMSVYILYLFFLLYGWPLSCWRFCQCDYVDFKCNGAEWSKDKTQAAESIKWRPQQAYGNNQFLLVQPQTVFSTLTKSSRSRIDKRTARATGNTRYRYSKIAPLDHKMADNCVSLARTNTLSSTITKLIKTSKTSNKSYSYSLLNRINKMYTHDLFYLQQEWEAWLAPVYIQIRTTKSQLTQCTKYKRH